MKFPFVFEGGSLNKLDSDCASNLQKVQRFNWISSDCASISQLTQHQNKWYWSIAQNWKFMKFPRFHHWVNGVFTGWQNVESEVVVERHTFLWMTSQPFVWNNLSVFWNDCSSYNPDDLSCANFHLIWINMENIQPTQPEKTTPLSNSSSSGEELQWRVKTNIKSGDGSGKEEVRAGGDEEGRTFPHKAFFLSSLFVSRPPRPCGFPFPIPSFLMVKTKSPSPSVRRWRACLIKPASF